MTARETVRSEHSVDEATRLAILDDYAILDTDAEQGFDDIVLLASRICQTPVALVSLVASDRQWFKARVGFDACETPLSQSVCANALLQPGLLIIPDLTADPRTRDNTLVTGGPRIRFYAGARLETDEGVALGTLCVIDVEPRPEGLTLAQTESLEALARQVMSQMKLRRSMAARDEAWRKSRESDARHRQIIDSAIDYAIITMNLNGLVTSWNIGAETILGWTEKEMCGQLAHVFFTEEDVLAGTPEREMAAARESGRGNDERWHQRKDGSRFFALGEMMPLHADDDTHIGYLKILRDRTDQRLATDVLQQQTDLLQTVADHVSEAVFQLDLDGVVTFANRTAHIMLGWDAGMLIGQDLHEAAHHHYPDGRPFPVSECNFVDAIREGKVLREREATFFRRDGTPVEMVCSNAPILRGEEIVGAVLTVSDVTKRRQDERRLRELNETLGELVAERTQERDRIWQVSQDMLGVADANGVWISINPAWPRILGWDYDEILGNTSEWLEHPDDREKTRAEVDRLAAGGLTLAFENRFRARDGSYRTLSWTAVPVEGLLYCVSRDVTEEKERAASLLQTQEVLRQSQKLEAVGQLTGGVAHDFNNLLTVIKSSTDLLKRPDLTEERRERYIGAISDTVDRAAKLTGQLLAFARRQALRPEVFDANQSVQAIGDMVATLTGARIEVAIRIEDESCRISADPSQFDTALVNMAVNARDAMDGEGRLTIAVDRASTIPALRSHPEQAGDFVRIALSDTGTGIPADQLDRIFEPFFTTKGVGQGTGLGLSQVFGFAKQSGGEVLVESEVGRGTTFSLYLPRATIEGSSLEDAASSEPTVDGRGTCVLVVEDNREVGLFSTQTLEELGYSTHWVANASEALLALAAKPIAYDVVFSDVVMPGMNGVELGREIRRLYPGLPVVLTSGYSHVLAQESDHGFELLQKPYSVEELSRLLSKAASRKRRRRVVGR
ncbi:PAS domain S-box protein [Methylobacterium sp. CM6247]